MSNDQSHKLFKVILPSELMDQLRERAKQIGTGPNQIIEEVLKAYLEDTSKIDIDI